MVTPDGHEPGCILDPVHWLRHALAATELLLGNGDEHDIPHADRLSSAALRNALATFSEREDWRTITLLEITEFASLMDGEKFSLWCTCRKPDRHSQVW